MDFPILPKITLEEAKEQLNNELEIGTICPCCGRFAKTYKRKITSAMAWGLILIYKHYRDNKFYDEFLHIENFFKNIKNLPSSIRGDITKLRHWGLIESLKEKRSDGNPQSGYYRITNLGIRFVRSEIKVKEHMLIYDDKVQSFIGKYVTITDCLGNKFNYDELVGNNETIGDKNN